MNQEEDVQFHVLEDNFDVFDQWLGRWFKVQTDAQDDGSCYAHHNGVHVERRPKIKWNLI